MTKRDLPSNASVAAKGEGARLVAPAASRNATVLGDLVARIAPETGRALEIASGTGQHVLHFSERCPRLHWQPTEVEPERLASINAYAAAQPNVAEAVYLDALKAGWHKDFAHQDLIVLINLLHLISWPESTNFVSEAALALQPGGRLMIYGPFKRGGTLTSDGDQRFHDALVGQDPEIGYKDDVDILRLFQENGLEILEIVEMPANNLAFIAKNSES